MPPDYGIMSGCIGDCDHCQLPQCHFDVLWEDTEPESGEDDWEDDCEGIGDSPQCLDCPHWGGEGLCCLSLSQEGLSQEETRRRTT